MQPYELPQCRTANNRENQQSFRNRDGEIWAPYSHGDRIYFTSDFDVSCTSTTGNLFPPRLRDPSKRRKRVLTAWTVKLNNDNRLIVEGSLECGRRARTKPIAERLSASTILSKFKHTYHLIGNMLDPQHELPGFVRHRFQAGFPVDWEIVVGIWKSFVTSRPNGTRLKSSCISGDLIIGKKFKLAVDGCSEDSDCFIEIAQRVGTIDNHTYPEYAEIDNKEIQDVGCHAENISIVNYESQDDSRSRRINNIKQLMGWTPLVVQNKTIEHCLVFRGTLLSSMGHPVNKNYVTNIVHRRLSARIIETVNQELYELIGNINNTKRDVPEELVVWCRYGCPKQIHLFCEKWRILRKNEMKFRNSLQGEMNISQNRRESHEICHKCANFNESGGTNPLIIIQPGGIKNKRKRIPMEFSNTCNTGNISVHSEMTFNEKSGSVLNNSQDRSWPKIRRRDQTSLPNTPRDDHTENGEDSKICEQIRPGITHEYKQQGSKQVPSLSYVYHRSAPLTECVLSDGV